MWKPEKFILKSCIFSFCLSKLQTDICSWTLCHRHPLVTLSGNSAILPFIMLIHLLLCLMCLGITQCLKYKTVDGNKLLINNLKPTHGVKVHVVVQWSSLIEKSSIACLLDLHKHCSSLHGCFLLHYHWCQRFLNRLKKKNEKLTELLIHNVCTQSHDGIRSLLQVWPLFEVPQCDLLFRWRVCREKWLHSTLSICFKLFSTLVLDESPFFKTDFGLTNSLKHSAITAHRAATSPLSPHRHNTHPLYSSFN